MSNVEEVVDYLKEFIVTDKPKVLASSEFERGKQAMLYELVDALERLLKDDE